MSGPILAHEMCSGSRLPRALMGKSGSTRASTSAAITSWASCRIHHAAAQRFALCDVEKGLAALFVGFQLFLLEAVGHLAPAGAALAGTLEADGGRQVEDDRTVGHDPVDRDALQRFDERLFEIAGNALIDAGGIHETIAQHDRAGGKRRADDLFDMVAARGGKKHGLHADAIRLGGTRKENVTHRLRAPGAHPAHASSVR